MYQRKKLQEKCKNILNDNKNTIYPNLLDAAKAMIRFLLKLFYQNM